MAPVRRQMDSKEAVSLKEIGCEDGARCEVECKSEVRKEKRRAVHPHGALALHPFALGPLRLAVVMHSPAVPKQSTAASPTGIRCSPSTWEGLALVALDTAAVP